jgi:hypothetical protein
MVQQALRQRKMIDGGIAREQTEPPRRPAEFHIQ